MTRSPLVISSLTFIIQGKSIGLLLSLIPSKSRIFPWMLFPVCFFLCTSTWIQQWLKHGRKLDLFLRLLIWHRLFFVNINLHFLKFYMPYQYWKLFSFRVETEEEVGGGGEGASACNVFAKALSDKSERRNTACFGTNSYDFYIYMLQHSTKFPLTYISLFLFL